MGKNFQFRIFLLLTAFSLLLAHPAFAAESTNNTDGFSIISAPMVKHMLESESCMIINVLSELEFDMQHITGSINIPISHLETTDQLPQDKNTALIVYCMGER